MEERELAKEFSTFFESVWDCTDIKLYGEASSRLGYFNQTAQHHIYIYIYSTVFISQ